MGWIQDKFLNLKTLIVVIIIALFLFWKYDHDGFDRMWHDLTTFSNETTQKSAPIRKNAKEIKKDIKELKE